MASIMIKPLPLSLVVVLGIVVRLLHLIPGDHYGILGIDSYYFHHMAENPGSVEGSGLVYPLIWLGKLITLDYACYVLPVIIAVIGILAIYWVVSRLFDPLVGLYAAFAWALLPNSVIITTAGFIDRDGLNVLLISSGVFAFWLLKDKCWTLAGLLPVAIGELVVFEWCWVGRWILVGLIMSVFLSTGFTRLKRLPLKPLSIVIVGSMLLAVIAGGIESNTQQTLDMANPVSVTSTTYAEIHHITPQYVVAWYGFFLLPLIVGIIMVCKNRTDAGMFALFWFGGGFGLALLAERCLIFALPGAVMLIGLCLASFTKGLYTDAVKKAAIGILGACLIMLVGSSYLQGYRLADFRGMSPNENWIDGLEYLRNETPVESRVLCHWDYGYWVLDIADRTPILKGGMENTEDYDADDIPTTMIDYHADYFIGVVSDCDGCNIKYINNTVMVLKGD